MLDAEQSYFQPAIDDIAMGLCQRFNGKLRRLGQETGTNCPVFSNTYQMYLKDALPRLKMDVLRAERGGYSFAIKIVRGAYMETERAIAAEKMVESPICNTIQDTHTNYNAAITWLIPRIADYKLRYGNCCSSGLGAVSLVVASHNVESSELASETMAKHNLKPNDGSVGFGQLLGMKDGLSGMLVNKGHNIYKYIPYGPLPITIPYLHRRALENSAILGGVSEDIKLLTDELKYRSSRK